MASVITSYYDSAADYYYYFVNGKEVWSGECPEISIFEDASLPITKIANTVNFDGIDIDGSEFESTGDERDVKKFIKKQKGKK